MNIADITPGMRVRITREWRAALRSEGLSDRILDQRCSGVVTEVYEIWGAAEYKADDGTIHVTLAGRLDRDTSDDVTVRIRRAAL